MSEPTKEEVLAGLPPCKDCGRGMLYAARALGTGLCHACAHKRYATLQQKAIALMRLLSDAYRRDRDGEIIRTEDGEYVAPENITEDSR